jgi:hypothetical protein
VPVWVTTMYPTDDRRYLCSELVSVLYEDGSHKTRATVANLEEISSRSAILLCEEHLKPGVPVALSSKGHDLYGIVASATFERLLGWYIVLRLELRSQWTSRWFLPEHLLCVGAASRPVINEPIGNVVV